MPALDQPFELRLSNGKGYPHSGCPIISKRASFPAKRPAYFVSTNVTAKRHSSAVIECSSKIGIDDATTDDDDAEQLNSDRSDLLFAIIQNLYNLATGAPY